MSLDKLDFANTARWTVRSQNDWVLDTFEHSFNSRAGVNCARLTTQTMNISVPIVDDTSRKTINDIKDLLEKADGTFRTELISSHIPDIDA